MLLYLDLFYWRGASPGAEFLVVGILILLAEGHVCLFLQMCFYQPQFWAKCDPLLSQANETYANKLGFHFRLVRTEQDESRLEIDLFPDYPSV